MIRHELVRAALDEALRRGEQGLQVAAYLDGELVVDEWIGTADPDTGRAVDANTLFPVFSVTKAVTATALHIQAERGLVDYESPVASYWPEYGVNGKQRTTVRDVLTHRSGAPQMPSGVTTEQMCDWEWMVDALAALTPIFEPGTTSAYHSISWGWLVGEIIRRTDPQDRSFQRFVDEEICQPLAIDDLFIGVPEYEHDRVATLVSDMVAWSVEDPLRTEVMPPAVAVGPAVFNRADVRAATIPGAGGIMTARAAARLFAMLANGGELDGVRLLSASRVLACTEPRANSSEVDRVGGVPRWIGVGGYWLGGELPPVDPVVGQGRHILCHAGAGGSIGWADIDQGVAVAIVHNRMFSAEAIDPSEHPLIPLAEAVRTVISGLRGDRGAAPGHDGPH